MNNYMMTVYKQQIENEDKEFYCIHLDAVDYIEHDKKGRVVFHIGDEHYYLISKRAELEELLSSRGFDALDRYNLVNIKKIKSFNREYGKVFFTENPDKNSKFALVARIKYAFMEKFIRRAIANNKGTTLEYEQKQENISLIKKMKGIF